MRGEASDSYRRAAMRLATACRDEGLRAAVLSSPTSGEGTTTTVVNLAWELKEHFGLRPLVVELNRARPALSKRFGLNQNESIESLANGKASVRDCIHSGKSGLEMIVANARGASKERGMDIRALLSRIVDEVKGEFDLVLVDAPPILSHTDAILAATVIPALILVVQAGKTPYEALDRVQHELANHNVTVFASVLNKHKRFIPGWIYRMIAR